MYLLSRFKDNTIILKNYVKKLPRYFIVIATISYLKLMPGKLWYFKLSFYR